MTSYIYKLVDKENQTVSIRSRAYPVTSNIHLFDGRADFLVRVSLGTLPTLPGVRLGSNLVHSLSQGAVGFITETTKAHSTYKKRTQAN